MGSMSWQDVAQALFPAGHQIVQDGDFLCGEARMAMDAGPDLTSALTWAVIGTCDHAEIGVEIALRQAAAVLEVVRNTPRRPLLLLVDTCGQRLRHRDEMLGINSYMAHLGKCLEYARQQGHIILALVYGQALSGGFLTSGLMADACYALPQALIKVMDLSAMARITKLPLARIEELARSNPVFAPGAENFVQMGALQALWEGDLALCLQQAYAHAQALGGGDQRALLGWQRGGRSCAYPLLQAYQQESAPEQACP